MATTSPLKGKPLRNPGESADEAIRLWKEDVLLGPFWFAGSFLLIAFIEWYGYLAHMPRQPIIFTCVAISAIGYATWRFFVIRRKVRQLRLGRDGELCVGQFLERLSENGGQVLHDIPGNGFNLDHVVISTRGIYAIETKTYSKPWPAAIITVEGDSLRIAGGVPDRDPIFQVTAAARWLESLLEQSTGKRFEVRGVVVFPGWFVEQRSERGPVWVLEPKALPAFIEQEPAAIAPTDVSMASFHLSRYVRSEVEKRG